MMPTTVKVCVTIVTICQLSLSQFHFEHDYYTPMRYRDFVSLNNTLTTNFGRPIGDKTNILTAGKRGPALLEDFEFIEEMAHFDRERIPERVVHARGNGAFGYFRVTNDITKYTSAAIFRKVGKVTPVAVRFSTVMTEMGAPDTVFGEPRGFAVKFYTEEGNWDLVGNNVPVFFIRDPQQFSSLAHSNKRNPASGVRDANAQWDFFSLRPESLNVVTYVYSDFGIPDGFRFMPGFSIDAFRFVNHQNQTCFVKFNWIPLQGIKNLDIDRAAYLRANEPDYARADLFNAIKRGDYPSYALKIQLMNYEDVDKFEYNAFDATKFWPEDRFPLIDVGVMTLNKNPDNFFAQIEQIAVDPANLVPGIEPSPDKLLLGRLFSYHDTQRYRLGANHHLIPVNQGKRVLTPTQRDGAMRVDGNFGSLVNYYPNSYSDIQDNPKYSKLRYSLSKYDNEVFRFETKDDDNYSQTKIMYYSFSEDWRQRIHRNIALALKTVTRRVQDRVIEQLHKVDSVYAEGVMDALIKYDFLNPKDEHNK